MKKLPHDENIKVSPEDIDPCTLYVGNLPTSVTVSAIKEIFSTATRIDVGYAQKMKFSRYAFVKYENVDLSFEAFRKSFNLEFNSRSLVVRFRRMKSNVNMMVDEERDKIVDDFLNLTNDNDVSDFDNILGSVDNCDMPFTVSELNQIAVLPTPSSLPIINDNDVQLLENTLNTNDKLKSHSSSTDDLIFIDTKDNVIVSVDDLSFTGINGCKIEKTEPENNIMGTHVKTECLENDDVAMEDDILEEDESEDENEIVDGKLPFLKFTLFEVIHVCWQKLLINLFIYLQCLMTKMMTKKSIIATKMKMKILVDIKCFYGIACDKKNYQRKMKR